MIALIALLIGVFQVVEANISMVHDISRKQGELSSKVDELNGKVAATPNTERSNETLQKAIDDFRNELAAAVARASTPSASEFRQLETRLLELESRVKALSNPSPGPRQR